MSLQIEPTMNERLVESNIPVATLRDVAFKYEISESMLIKLLDRYFSPFELEGIEEFVRNELDADYVVESEAADQLLNSISDNELKKIATSAGAELSGRENKDELKGMVKAFMSEGYFSPESLGGYKAEVYLKASPEYTYDAAEEAIENLSESIKRTLNSSSDPVFSNLTTEEVLVNELPRSLFESKQPKKTKLSKFVR